MVVTTLMGLNIDMNIVPNICIGLDTVSDVVKDRIIIIDIEIDTAIYRHRHKRRHRHRCRHKHRYR